MAQVIGRHGLFGKHSRSNRHNLVRGISVYMPCTAYTPTATLLEHVLLAQGFMGVSNVSFPRRLQLQNRDSTGASLSNAIKCRCRDTRIPNIPQRGCLARPETATRSSLR